MFIIFMARPTSNNNLFNFEKNGTFAFWLKARKSIAKAF